jgi:nucleotide-binding universal stress UspA family protein
VLQVEARLCRGPTVASLVDEADRQRVDAIAVGAHNQRGFVEAVLGSVATSLVARSRLPVLVVKPPRTHGIAVVM